MKTWMGGAAALLFGLAAVVGAFGYLVGNLPEAEAQDFGPVITGGETPFVSGSGNCAVSSTCVLYTVPVDRSFVLTGFSSRYVNFFLYENDGAATVERFRGQSGAGSANGINTGSAGGSGYLAAGRGAIVFAAGSTVDLATGDFALNYSFQGYLAAP